MIVDLVEDDPGVRRLLIRLLESAGYQVRAFEALAPALARTLASPPDLVVTDLGLPDGSGVELIREVRERIPDLPILVVSGLSGDGDRVLASAAGADAYVAKPFMGDEVLERCAQLLARTALPRAV